MANIARALESQGDLAALIQTTSGLLILDDRTGFIFNVASLALAKAKADETGAPGFASELFAGVASYYAAIKFPPQMWEHERASREL
ncbi:MAG: hypothetical protein ACREDR_31310 [Blastocatellia bacterium]